jgi:hypothetical protein
MDVDFELLIERALGVPDAEANRKNIAVLRLAQLANVSPPPADEQKIGWLNALWAVGSALLDKAQGLARTGEFDYAFANVAKPFQDRSVKWLVSRLSLGIVEVPDLGVESTEALQEALVSAVVEYVHAHPILESSTSPQESEKPGETPRTSEK